MPTGALPLDQATLPHGVGAALWRGIRCKCPRCGESRLFARFLKPVSRCPACSQNWTLHAADDIPPYISILLTGHVMAPIIIELGLNERIPGWAMMAIVAIMAIALLISLLQPAKGAVIALQWWLGLNGFASAPGKMEAGAT